METPPDVIARSGEPPRVCQKVVLCTPTITRPHPAYLDALEASVPSLDAAGLLHSITFEVGSPYISAARAHLLRKALDEKPDVVVFIDHDLSWSPDALVKLIQTKGDVVSGLYRFKKEPVEYMGTLETHADGRPIIRDDGSLMGERVPAGFLKVTTRAVHDFMGAYPNLIFGPRYNPSVDIFNHGAHDGLWWGEDYAFSRNWRAMGREIVVVPDLDLTHHSETEAFPGNYHQFLLRRPGGQLAEAA